MSLSVNRKNVKIIKTSGILAIVLMIGGACSPAIKNEANNSAPNSIGGASRTSPVSESQEATQPPKWTSEEPTEKQFDTSVLLGKYDLTEIGLSGEHTLELKDKNTATFKVLEEDGTSTGNGSWNWDQAKELLIVTLSIKTEFAGEEVEKAHIAEAWFQFKKEGKNLKIVKETWSPDSTYTGKIFKKL